MTFLCVYVYNYACFNILSMQLYDNNNTTPLPFLIE